MDKLGYAIVEGVGTMVIPSPRPQEVGDLVLEPNRWKHVDPVFLNSPIFRRYKDQGAFEYQELETTPVDPDYSIAPEQDSELEPHQRVFVQQVVTLDMNPQFQDIINLGNQVSDNGIPLRNSRVTVTYLREKHRPMLLAIQELEKRHRKRKSVLSLIKKQLDRIAGLPS